FRLVLGQQVPQQSPHRRIVNGRGSAHEAERGSGALFTETEIGESLVLRRTAGKRTNEFTQFGRRETCRLVEQRSRTSPDQFRGSVERADRDKEVARVVRIRFKRKRAQPQEDVLGVPGPPGTCRHTNGEFSQAPRDSAG